MNRLTARSKNGEAYYPVCIEACDGEPQDCGNCDIDKDICDRLAAYEDTGLEPEEIPHWISVSERLPEEPAITHNEESRSCENCGNIQCANSPIAYHWDECVDTNFTKHWIPKPPKKR